MSERPHGAGFVGTNGAHGFALHAVGVQRVDSVTPAVVRGRPGNGVWSVIWAVFGVVAVGVVNPYYGGGWVTVGITVGSVVIKIAFSE